eukprot:354661-Chlamydomonas_euryale.AAC.2
MAAFGAGDAARSAAEMRTEWVHRVGASKRGQPTRCRAVGGAFSHAAAVIQTRIRSGIDRTCRYAGQRSPGLPHPLLCLHTPRATNLPTSNRIRLLMLGRRPGALKRVQGRNPHPRPDTRPWVKALSCSLESEQRVREKAVAAVSTRRPACGPTQRSVRHSGAERGGPAAPPKQAIWEGNRGEGASAGEIEPRHVHPTLVFAGSCSPSPRSTARHAARRCLPPSRPTARPTAARGLSVVPRWEGGGRTSTLLHRHGRQAVHSKPGLQDG